jgi:hypothetical protein
LSFVENFAFLKIDEKDNFNADAWKLSGTRKANVSNDL